MIRLIRKQARSGIFLSVLGLGTGNYKDAVLESLANRGNGNFFYLDSLKEARKGAGARDWEPLWSPWPRTPRSRSSSIRPGSIPTGSSATRTGALRNEEFNDDTRDGGEIGAGQQVTGLVRNRSRPEPRSPGARRRSPEISDSPGTESGRQCRGVAHAEVPLQAAGSEPKAGSWSSPISGTRRQFRGGLARFPVRLRRGRLRNDPARLDSPGNRHPTNGSCGWTLEARIGEDPSRLPEASSSNSCPERRWFWSR